MTRFPRLLTLATLLLVALVALASPPAKPNFSGTWVLDLQKSDFGPLPAPKSRTDQITQKDANLTVTRRQVAPNDQSTSVTVTCLIGGGPCTSTYSQSDAKLKAKALWEGETLVIDSVLTTSGVDFQVRDVYSLAPGGKVLTIKRHIASSQGDGDQTFVLNKQ